LNNAVVAPCPVMACISSSTPHRNRYHQRAHYGRHDGALQEWRGHVGSGRREHCGSTSLSAGTIELSTGGTLANSVTASAGTSLVVDTTSYIPTSRIGGNSCTFTSANFSVVVASGATGDTTDTFTYMAGVPALRLLPLRPSPFTMPMCHTLIALLILSSLQPLSLLIRRSASPAMVMPPSSVPMPGSDHRPQHGQQNWHHALCRGRPILCHLRHSLGVRALNEAGGEAVALASGLMFSYPMAQPTIAATSAPFSR